MYINVQYIHMDTSVYTHLLTGGGQEVTLKRCSMTQVWPPSSARATSNMKPVLVTWYKSELSPSSSLMKHATYKPVWSEGRVFHAWNPSANYCCASSPVMQWDTVGLCSVVGPCGPVWPVSTTPVTWFPGWVIISPWGVFTLHDPWGWGWGNRIQRCAM